MPLPIVIAHHLIWTLYGWWLPNDPRGSCSETIKSDFLKPLGDLHYGRKKIQPPSREIRAFYEDAAPLLKHPLLDLSDAGERACVADGFADAIAQHKYTCYAGAILPDHVHLIIRKHKHTAEEMIDNLQSGSRSRLSASSLRPENHPTWCRSGWKVFLDHPDEVWRTIHYIEKNPIPYRLPVQQWSFVAPYDNWPLHQGHSHRSPYVKILQAVGRYPHDAPRGRGER